MAVKVRERGGAWWLFIDYKGRRKARRVGAGKAGKRAAKAAAEKIQAKLALGDTALLDETRDTARTFTEFAEGWLKHVAAQRKPGTSEKYEMILRVSVQGEHLDRSNVNAQIGAR